MIDITQHILNNARFILNSIDLSKLLDGPIEVNLNVFGHPYRINMYFSEAFVGIGTITDGLDSQNNKSFDFEADPYFHTKINKMTLQ